jgi:hypothetical protein
MEVESNLPIATIGESWPAEELPGASLLRGVRKRQKDGSQIVKK